MDVILLDDVEKLGLRGEVVSVARGYARNFLLPRRLAEPATPAKVAELRKRDERRARHEARSVDQAQAMAERLRSVELRFEVKAGPTGSLFGSVTPTNVADELWRTSKVRVDRRKIGMDVIKRIGRYEVPVELFQDVRVDVRTVVVPEGGDLPSDEELAAMEAAERGEEQAAQAPAETVEPAEDELQDVLAAEAAPAAEAQAQADDEPEPEAEAEAVDPELEPEPGAAADEPAAEVAEEPARGEAAPPEAEPEATE